MRRSSSYSLLAKEEFICVFWIHCKFVFRNSIRIKIVILHLNHCANLHDNRIEPPVPAKNNIDVGIKFTVLLSVTVWEGGGGVRCMLDSNFDKGGEWLNKVFQLY